jgi:hypothetical protein
MSGGDGLDVGKDLADDEALEAADDVALGGDWGTPSLWHAAGVSKPAGLLLFPA